MVKKLFIISGASGSGKDTITQLALQHDKNLEKIITYTTRKPRLITNEKNGSHYHFISKNQFLLKIKDNFFIDWQVNYGEYYGIPCHALTSLDKHTLLVIDVKGAQNLKNQNLPNCVFIFVHVPFEEIERRLRKRKTESQEEIDTRLKFYRDEMSYVSIFDYIINNNIKEEAINSLKGIILKNK